MTSIKQSPDYIGTDQNGVDVLYVPKAELPNSRYQFHYPETKHGKTIAEDFPIQMGDPDKVGVNGGEAGALLMVLIHDLSKQHEKCPSPILTEALFDLVKARKLLKLRFEFMAENGLEMNYPLPEATVKKEVIKLNQHKNRQQLQLSSFAMNMKK